MARGQWGLPALTTAEALVVWIVVAAVTTALMWALTSLVHWPVRVEHTLMRLPLPGSLALVALTPKRRSKPKRQDAAQDERLSP